MQKTVLQIEGSKHKPINIDVTYWKNEIKKPAVIFCHGFKGFKDWGHFNLIAQSFAKEGFTFVKFSFSYNGTTTEHPIDFADLEAFGQNNFSIELDDLGLVIDFVKSNSSKFEIDINEIYLIGHSRGGGIAILKAAEDAHIKKLITWASVKDFQDFFNHQDIEQWKTEGKIYTYNSRTEQNMLLDFQLYENFISNKERLNIPKAATSLKKPWCIVHGTKDSSVSIQSAHQLHQWNSNSSLIEIQNADHTFGGKHPWNEKELPEHSIQLVLSSISFLKK